MAGHLPKLPADFHNIDNSFVDIIAASWHREYVDNMIARAILELKNVKCTDVCIHYLPGSYELPLAARMLFEKKPKLSAIIAFGIVLEGKTNHNQSVLQEVTNGFSKVMHDFKKPIINEVIGVSCLEDAKARSGDDNHNKGLEAVYALTEFLNWQVNL